MESNQKKQLKRAFLTFFGAIYGENLNKTVIAQTSFPCYETKSFAKKILMKLYNVDTRYQLHQLTNDIFSGIICLKRASVDAL